MMYGKTKFAMVLFVLSAFAMPAVAQRAWRGAGPQGGGSVDGICQNLANLPMQDLSNDEKVNLLYMREEEKLARDVYEALFEQYDLPVFARIAVSEQRHFDALGRLLTRYQLDDPAQGQDAGKFSNSALQTMYKDLMGKAKSTVEALQAGALIEEVDIHDLGKAIEATDNEDLKTVYTNLQLASRNHLRAFVRQIEALGITYQSQHMPQNEVDAILDAAQERGMGPGMGMGFGARGGRRGGNPDSCPLRTAPQQNQGPQVSR